MTKALNLTALLIILSVLTALATDEQQAMQNAKSLMFEKKYKEALVILDDILLKGTKSDSYSIALFFKAKCLEGINDKNSALEVYRKFLKTEKNEALKEEARVAVIDIAYEFYVAGKENFLGYILNFLDSNEDNVAKYYAAFKLSYAKDNKVAHLSVPVLKTIINTEKDRDLKDRAKLALLRIDPALLKEIESDAERKELNIKIVIYDKAEKKIKADIIVPIALADLAVRSLPESERRKVIINNITLETLLSKISQQKDGIFSIEDENTIIKVYLEKH